MPQRPIVLLAATILLAIPTASCLGGRDRGITPDSTVGDVRGRSGRNAPDGIGVNAFLWTATLDTIEVMPIESADPYSGLITTEWYANPEMPDERFKLSVRILDTRLRADGVKATLHRQIYLGEDRGWIDGDVADASEIQIENAILTRAQQLRISTIE
ncbi:MAG: DUF3576 domain-containing protein [Maricaulaceae bacterium]|jgi:hypothetical protein